MKTRSPIEVTTRYATTVETLQDAFSFVMSQLDAVGERPQITINPVWSYSMAEPDADPETFFEVVVSSMREAASE